MLPLSARSVPFFSILALIFVAAGTASAADKEPVMKWANNTLLLDNDVISRKIIFDEKKHALQTTEMKLKGDAFNHVGKASDEFSFEINDVPFTGAAGWEVKSVDPASDDHQGQGAAVVLKRADADQAGVELKITYLLYPDSPTVRKRLTFTNVSEKEIKLEAVDVERFSMTTPIWKDQPYNIYTNYARRVVIGSYLGDVYDSVVVIHNISSSNGVVLGNESPGFLKRTTAFLDGAQVSIGLTHKDQKMPFRKWIKPKESWESPWSFVCLYHKLSRPNQALSGPVAEYIRKYMPLHLTQISYRPACLYDTYVPFGEKLSDKMALELAQAAAECGVKDYLLDAGWHRNANSPVGEPWLNACGDWFTDLRKFPRAMPPFFADIAALGFNCGIWMSLADVGETSNVFHDHPEWLIRDKDGKPINLHIVRNGMDTACLTTGWYDYIKTAMLKTIDENKLKYFMIDIAYVQGTYRFDGVNGCSATDHAHKDREESYWMMYEKSAQLVDELHAAHPGLFVDFSFEAMGAYQLMDLGMLKHADGCWIVNCGDAPPIGTLRIRNLAWWMTAVIPPESLPMGNLRMDFPETDLMMSSLSGTFPVLLGDPRKLTVEKRARFKQWSDWFVAAQKRNDFSLYRQDLIGFGEPQEGSWDGFQRINLETKSGGIVGVFRQGGNESKRTVFVESLKPAASYEITKAPEGSKVATLTGEELEKKGFNVELTNPYDGADFEINEVK